MVPRIGYRYGTIKIKHCHSSLPSQHSISTQQFPVVPLPERTSCTVFIVKVRAGPKRLPGWAGHCRAGHFWPGTNRLGHHWALHCGAHRWWSKGVTAETWFTGFTGTGIWWGWQQEDGSSSMSTTAGRTGTRLHWRWCDYIWHWHWEKLHSLVVKTLSSCLLTFLREIQLLGIRFRNMLVD
jgi:hypothetical protein